MKRSFGTMEESSGSVCQAPTLPATVENLLPEHHFHLGDSNYVVVTYFANSLFIHLRQYLRNENGILYATRKGVTFTPTHWLSFIKKPETFKESVMGGNITILDDSLLISKVLLDTGVYVTFQKYFTKKDFSRQFTPTLCMLSEQEFVELTCNKTLQRKITSSIISLSYKHVFPQIVLEKVKNNPLPTTPSDIEMTDVYDALSKSMTELIKTNIELNVNSMFECTQNYENQLGHECLTSNYGEKLYACENIVMLSIDLEQLARNFIELNFNILNYVNTNFFSKLDVHLLISNAKKIYVASDPEPLRLF